MSQQTARLQLPFLQSGQAQKHVTVNESLLRLDALVQLAVVSASTAAQPGSPTDGDIYILPSGKSGADWGGMANGALAYYRDGVWEELTPRAGLLAHVDDTGALLVHSGATWEDLSVALRAWRVLAHSGVAASVTGTTSETTLATAPVPAQAMGPNGVLRVTSLWSYTNSANIKTLKVAFGGSNFLFVAPTTTATFQAVTTIGNRNAANAQVGPPSAAASTGGMGATAAARVTASIDTTVAQDVAFKATLANAGETITLESYVVEVAYGA